MTMTMTMTMTKTIMACWLDTTTPRWIQLDWAGIDTLVVYNSSPTAWAMDEFTVPEPGSLALGCRWRYAVANGLRDAWWARGAHPTATPAAPTLRHDKS